MRFTLPLLLLCLCGCPSNKTDTAPGDTDTNDTNTDTDTNSDDGHHPDGYSDPAVHGMAAKIQEEACVTCHGEDLLGGSVNQSCDTCHPTDWRTDCAFCHGGTDNATGAPPVDIDNSTSNLSFPAHTVHLTANSHPSWTCNQCHAKPSDILSTGHFLIGDTTGGVAEIGFSAGISPQGSYNTGTCDNLYCHSNGAGTEISVSTTDNLSCSSCHSSNSLSGGHWHVGGEVGATCEDCHASTASGSSSIADGDLHVNGSLDVEIPTMTYSNGRCTGSCHGENHNGESFSGGGDDD